MSTMTCRPTTNPPHVIYQNSKWDCIRRNEMLSSTGDTVTSQRLQTFVSHSTDGSQRKFVDLIKYSIVSTVLACVLLGGCYVAWFGDISKKPANGGSPVQYYEENSYFWGLLKVIKLNTTDSAGVDTGKVLIELPQFVDAAISRIQEVVDSCSWYLNFFSDSTDDSVDPALPPDYKS